MSQRFLITGATGFVGRHLTQHLLSSGHCVRRGLRCPAPAMAGVEDLMVGEIDRVTNWTRALENVDVVVHLAARAHVLTETEQDPVRAFEAINVDGTETLARAAATARVRRFVFISSAGVFGYTARSCSPFDERSPLNPPTPYARSKLAAEERIEHIVRQTGLSAVSIRPPLVYGPGNGGNFRRLLKLVDYGLPLPFAAIDNLRSLIYVDNLVSAIHACAIASAGCAPLYVVRDDEDVSLPDLIRALSSAFQPSRPRPWRFPTRLLSAAGSMVLEKQALYALLGSLRVDDTCIRSQLNWRPHVSLQLGLERTVAWYQASSRV